MDKNIKTDTNKDNQVLQMMNDITFCSDLEESKVGVSNYTKLPLSRLKSLGTAFQPLSTAVQTAINGAGGSGLYYVNTDGKTMFQMKGSTKYFSALMTSEGSVGGGQIEMPSLACRA